MQNIFKKSIQAVLLLPTLCAAALGAAYVPQAEFPVPMSAVRGMGSDAVGNLYVLGLAQGATDYSVFSYRTHGMEPLLSFNTGIADPRAFGVSGSGELSILEFTGSGFVLTRFDNAGTLLGETAIEPGLYDPSWLGMAVDAEARLVLFGVRVRVTYFCLQCVGCYCPPPEDKGTVYAYDFDGTFAGSFPMPGGSNTSGSCYTPTAVGGDGAGGAYVGDDQCRRLLKFASDGSVVRDQDAQEWSYNFNPTAMWLDPAANLYISQSVCPPSGCRRGVVKLSGSGQVLDKVLHDSPAGCAWDQRILYLSNGGSAPLTRLIRDSAPSIPAQSAPIGGVAQHPDRAALSWEGSSDPEGDPVAYHLYMGTAAAGTAPIGEATLNEFETEPLEFGTTYYWRVVAEDSYLGLPILRTDTPVVSFNLSLVNEPPGAFGVVSGTGTAVTRDSSITFGWERAVDPDDDPVEYELSWRTGEAEPAVVHTTATAVELAGLDFDATYYWSVRAVDIYDAESLLEGGAEQSYLPVFKNSAPRMAESYLDGDGVYEVHADSVAVRLAWETAPDADGDAVLYRVRLGSDAGSLSEASVQSETAFDLGYLPVGSTVYWSVRAEDPYGGVSDGKDAAAEAVFVNASPGAFGVLSGTGTATTRETAALLRWEEAVDPDGDAVSYTLHLSTEPDFLPAVYSGAAAEYLLENMSFGATYYWSVIARDPYDALAANDGGPQGLLHLFQNVAPETPEVLAGTGISLQHTLTPSARLEWSSVLDPDEDAVSYTLLLGTATEASAALPLGTETTYDLPSPSFGTTYYWQVRAEDLYGAVSETAVQDLRIELDNAPPGSFDALSGTGILETRETGAWLSWDEAIDPDDDPLLYELALSSDGAAPAAVQASSATSFYLEFVYDSTYTWTVEARDGFGGRSLLDDQIFQPRFLNSAPSVPSILGGTGVSQQHTLTPSARLSWSTASDPEEDAVRYTLLLGAGPEQLAAVQEGESTFYDLPSPSFGTTYYWQVRAEDLYGARSETAVQNLRIELDNAPPGAFGALSGTGTLETRETSIELTWESALDPNGDPVVYELALSTDAGALLPVQSSSAASFSLAFDYGATYYWTVAAQDGFGGETVLPVQAFLPEFRNAAPPVPAVVSGSGVSRQHTLSPEATLSWSTVSDPDGDPVAYRLLLGALPESMAPVLEGTDTAYELPSPAFDTTYYWQVEVEDIYGAASATEVQPLLIELDNAPPSAFGVLSGAGTLATRETSASLSWEGALDPDGDTVAYELALSTDSEALFSVQDSAETSYRLDFAYGTTYYWTVAARDGFGGETRLALQSFLPEFRNSAPSVPANLSKTGTLAFHGLSPELAFFWEPATDLDGDLITYSVEFGTDASKLASLGAVELGHKATGLKTGLAYHYRILAKDPYGGVSDSPTAWVFFEFVNEDPGKFAVRSGTGTFSTRATSAGLSWDAASDPDGDPVRYTVLAGTSAADLVPVQETEALSGTLDGLAFGTTYYWTVETRDHLGGLRLVSNGPHALRHEFQNSAPAAPVYSAGTGNLAQRTLTPGATVAWEPSLDADGDAVRYELRFGADLDNMPVVLDAAATAHFLPGLQFDATYYWRVSAYDPYSRSEGGAVSLNISLDNRAPNAIAYLSPETLATRATSYTLAWEDSGDPDGEAVLYALELSTVADRLAPAALGSEMEFTIELEYGATTYYRVSALDRFGARTAGETRSFLPTFLNDPPAEVEVEAPFVEAPLVRTMRDSVELSWKAVTNAQGDPITYTVYLGDHPEELAVLASLGQASAGSVLRVAGGAPAARQLRLEAALPRVNARSAEPQVFLSQDGELVSLRLSGLDYYRTYYLKIAAENPYGARSETGVQSFTLSALEGFPAAYNYPNPFSPLRGGTKLVFNAPPSGFARATVEVYSEFQDLLYKREFGPLPPGITEVGFEGRDRYGRAFFNGGYIVRVRFEGPKHEEIFHMLVVK